jgi:catechol-2,3-dioxygenase
MNHLAVTLGDLQQSEAAFYAPVLSFLGYERIEDHGEMTLWYSASARAAVNLWQAKPQAENFRHDRYRPGFHHFAFEAESREDVDRLYAHLVRHSIRVVEGPAEYPQYLPDYYALFFADPDGLKFEFVHFTWPG